ncbi:hypothetical protein CLIB1444_08S01860 [[Candida] jaroonii]|uniref:Uncharacterized protein n=1 Tax=[Candida] jaroonii TaxID=467808 RepID=A0ACA9YBM6_9ASCO|nr:hypothetical protein CLIB1444_08S01860 [[Candida] jaroonii]
MSFIDYYPIITLPRVSDIPLPNKVVIPPITNINETIIDVGISKSNISSYIIKPSPRLIWSHPISPSCIIECMDSKDHQEYIVGVTDRKVHKVIELTKEGEQSKEFKIHKCVKSIKYLGDRIVMIFQDGELMFINDINELENDSSKSTKSKSELIYSNVGENIIIITKTKDQFIYKVFDLQGNIVNELQERFEQSLFEYNDEFLYKSCNGVLSKMDLSLKVVKQWDIGIDITSMSVSNEDRLIISNDQKIMLVNMRFETLLDTLDINEDIYIDNVIKITEPNGINTFGLFLKLNNKKNKTTLNITNINVGLNNLVNNLGKKFEKPQTKLVELKSLKNINDIDEEVEIPDIFQNSDELKILKYFKNIKKLDYYSFEDTDSIIDINLIPSLFNSKTIEELSQMEFLMHYLLSHPFFPKEKTIGLIKILENPKLIKQCITKCSNLPVEELYENLTNKTFFKETVNRICENNLIEILPGFQSYLQSHNIEFDELLNNLIELDSINSWNLIKLIIDINGLFNLSNELIDKLILLINDKLDILELNNFNLTLLNSNDFVKSESLPNYSYEKLII